MKRGKSSVQDWKQDTRFIEEAQSKYVKMSDGAELLVRFTETNENNSDISIVFIPGFSTGNLSWNDLWSQIYQDYNLYVLEKRELRSSKVKWGHKADMDRLALDICETINELNLNEKNVVLFGTCLGSSLIAHALALDLINPLGIVLNAPPRKFMLPRVLLPLAYIFPSFFLGILGKPLIYLWLQLLMPKGKQRDLYKENVRNATGMRWKKFLPLAKWDSYVDYPHIKCPCLVVNASGDRMHEAKITNEVYEMIEGAELLDTPSYYWIHHNPGATEFRENIKAFMEKLIK